MGAEERHKENAYSFKAARVVYFTALIFFSISLVFNQIDHFNQHEFVLNIIDLTGLGIIYIFLVLYILNSISFQLNSAVFVYVVAIDLMLSTWYYYLHQIDFTASFLLVTFICCLDLVVAGICIGRRHVYVLTGLFLPGLGVLIYYSDDPFLIKSAPMILLLMLGFSFAIFAFLYLLDNSYKKERALTEEIHQKDKAFAQEQNKRLRAELENKQKEITIKTMSLLEYIENHNTLIKKLDGFKSKMNHRDLEVFNETIHQYSLENHENYWKEFELSFLKVHPDFFKKLGRISDKLSPAELKLAALIHLGLSSKQIGSLTSVTPESVDVARSRLRSKLNLPMKSNLRLFLLKM